MQESTKSNHFLSFHNYKIVKSNKLIESKSDYSALQQKIILLALVQIKPSDPCLHMYKIYIRDVLGSNNSSHYDYVREAVERLHQSVIKIENEHEWTTYSFITKAHGKSGQNFIEIQFHEDIQQFLLGLKSHYTSYVLGNVIKFKKNYSLRIYELCKQYEAIGKREWDIEYLKTILSLEDKYDSLHSFKRYVLDASLKEINEYSDLFLDYHMIKEGRKVKKIVFHIKANEMLDFQNLLSEKYQHMCESLLKIGFSHKDVKDLLNKYEHPYLFEKLSLLNEQIDKIKAPLAWLRKAIEEDYKGFADYKKYLLEEKKNSHGDKKKKEELSELREQEKSLSNLISRLQSTGFNLAEKQFIYKGQEPQSIIALYQEELIKIEKIIKEKSEDS